MRINTRNEFYQRTWISHCRTYSLFFGTIALLIAHICLKRALIPFTPCLIGSIIVFFHGKWIADDAKSELSETAEETPETVHQ